MKFPNSLSTIQADIKSKKYTLVELVYAYLDEIENTKTLNIYLEVWKDEAIKKAQSIQQKMETGNAGPLAGMVIGLKDNICYAGHSVSAASKILEGFESLYSSTVVERLLEADALFIGRLNCDEFAMGSSNENSAFGAVKNPHNTECVPGGSSGGSAAAVAANTCLVALGSDTGGSIRQPASFCGVVGMKPTYGSVSRYGLIAYASSMDQIGPFANSVKDVIDVLAIISGKDDFDSTLSKRKSSFNVPSKKHKIAYLKECFDAKGLDEEVKNAHFEKIEELRADGHCVEAVSFPYLNQLVPCYNLISNAEAASNLSRFDGMRYGYRSKNSIDLETTYIKSRTEGFGKEVKRRIMLGNFVLSAGYFDAYYSKAQRVRRLIQEKTFEILSEYDFILTPTTPHTAFKIGTYGDDPVAMYLEDIYTVQANLAGVPGISIPLFRHSNGMPFGMQLIANKFEDGKLLQFADELLS